MKLDLNLRPLQSAGSPGAEGPVRAYWDSEAGTVSGDGAQAISWRIRAYAGKSYGVPHRQPPESFLVKDPLRNPEEMAILLGEVWSLPPELEALYPSTEGPTGADLVN